MEATHPFDTNSPDPHKTRVPEDTALALATLLAPATARGPVSPRTLARWIDERLQNFEPPTGPRARDGEDPVVFFRWLLKAAARTHRNAVERSRPRAPHLRARLDAHLEARPDRNADHGQLHIDTQSTVARALAIQELAECRDGPILAVGDDDATTLALSMLGIQNVHAVDIDARLLTFLEETSRREGNPVTVHQCDVLAHSVPKELRHACSVVVTDPLRSLEPCLQFLLFSSAALGRGRAPRLLFCDHPEWNFDHAATMGAVTGAGFVVHETLEDLHSYPLDPSVFPLLDDMADALGVDREWLRDLTRVVRAFSHLHVLGRA